MSDEPESEWMVKRAVELADGDHIAGDLLPLGVPGEVIFLRPFTRDRSDWVFVAFVQRDGFHDSTTFLADAPIRVRSAEPQRVSEPPTQAEIDAAKFAGGLTAAAAQAYEDDDEGDRLGIGYSRADDGDVTQQLGHRVEPHAGAVTDKGLVDMDGFLAAANRQMAEALDRVVDTEGDLQRLKDRMADE